MNDRRITPQLREKLLEHHPGLDEEEGHWRFLEYLLFSGMFDRLDQAAEKVVVPRDVLQPWYGRHRTVAEYVDWFSSDTGIELVVHVAKKNGRFASTVEWPVPMHQEVWQAYAKNLESPLEERTVYMVSGDTVTKKRERKRREEHKTQVCEQVRQVASEATHRKSSAVLQTVNEHTTSDLVGRLVSSGVETVRETALLLPDCKRCEILRILDAIEQNPRSVYYPTERSDRIYPVSYTHLRAHET